MAIGKNKKLKTGKKGAKKRLADPFVRKEWYDIRAPNVFRKRNVGKTVITKTQGTKIASEGLKGRVFTVSLADLTNNEDKSFRKFRLRCEDVSGQACLTNFWGMDFTTDKLRSLVHKWRTLIECFADVKTLDGYTLRMFCIGFTRRQPNQLRKTSYAQTSQIRAIRKKMVEIMTKTAATCDLKHLVRRFIAESIGNTIQKNCERIYPLQDVFIRKVKVLKAPKFDAVKLAELHADVQATKKKKATEDTGVKVVAPTKPVVGAAATTQTPAQPQAPLVGEAQPQ